ncbi:MAG: hypothetical protein ACI4B6_07125 [Atopobiaceae bacterium]
MDELSQHDAKPKSYFGLRSEPERIKYLSRISGATAGLIAANLGYQMQFSVQALETELAVNGTPHILQLNLDWAGKDWRNPSYWWLFADGREVASGTGDYAWNLMAESATGFQDLCRDAIAEAKLPTLDDKTFQILKLARSIAAREPYGEGWEGYGERTNRVF